MGNNHATFMKKEKELRKGSLNQLIDRSSPNVNVKFEYDDSIGFSEEEFLFAKKNGYSRDSVSPLHGRLNNFNKSKTGHRFDSFDSFDDSYIHSLPLKSQANKSLGYVDVNSSSNCTPTQTPKTSKLFGINKSSKRSLIGLQTPKTPSSFLESNGISYFKKMEFLQELTCCHRAEVIYNSDIHGFDTRELNQRITCKDNLTFIITTENNEEFGFYQKDVVPPGRDYSNTQILSSEFVLFALKGKVVKPTSFYRKDSQNSFTLHSNTDKRFLITCYSAFWITCQRKVCIHQFLMKHFNLPANVNNPLTSTFGTSCSLCKKIVVLEWKDTQ
ncbi:TLDc domain-containing protein [Entamoeba marina]